MRWKERRARLAALSVGLVLAAPAAHAQPAASPPAAQDEQAARFWDEGVAAAEAGDYATALRAFQASYELGPQADTLYNIAMCFKALGDLPGSANAFAAYVAQFSDRMTDEERAEFDSLLVDLVPQIGRIAIEVNEPDATVTIDATGIGASPLVTWRAVEPGPHVVGVEKDGFVATSQVVNVGAGGFVTATLGLEATRAAVAEPALPEAPAAEPAGLSPWFWTMVAVTGAAAVGTAITGGLTLSYNDEYDAGGHLDADLRDTALALRTTTDALLGVTIAAAVTATVLAFVLPDEEAAPEGDESGVALGPAGFVAWW